MLTKQPRRILIAPLDWGMGHTTRCVPVIDCLRVSGHTPVFAGNEWQRAFIEKIFPGIENIHIDGYDVRWSGNMASFLTQVPRISQCIKQEHKWLEAQVSGLSLDGVISDNRYGLHHSGIPCVVLTHQLQPLSGMGVLGDVAARKTHYALLQKFNEVWVPDLPAVGIAGRLSHPETMPEITTYIGLLSSFADWGRNNGEPGSLLVLLSGPEPQRSILSASLKTQLRDWKTPLTFVEGSTNGDRSGLPPAALHFNRLTPEELRPHLHAADTVICRSGYSTLMDLLALGKRAILIPTPGQTEQAYLGQWLTQYGFHTIDQDSCNLDLALKTVSGSNASKAVTPADFQLFKPVLTKWAEGL